jgi:hypothetical protein
VSTPHFVHTMGAFSISTGDGVLVPLRTEIAWANERIGTVSRMLVPVTPAKPFVWLTGKLYPIRHGKTTPLTVDERNTATKLAVRVFGHPFATMAFAPDVEWMCPSVVVVRHAESGSMVEFNYDDAAKTLTLHAVTIESHAH